MRKPIGRLEKHHIVPISTGGENIKENLQSILDYDHKAIHDTLDIPIRFYSEKIRKIKEKTNHHIITKPDDIHIWGDLQKEYFSRVHQLTTPIQKLHLETMEKLVHYRDNQYQRVAKDTMIEGWEPQGRNTADKFHYAHDTYIDIKKEICREIGKILYNNNL